MTVSCLAYAPFVRARSKALRWRVSRSRGAASRNAVLPVLVVLEESFFRFGFAGARRRRLECVPMESTILLWVLAVLLILGGLAGMLLPALPGPPLLFFGLLLAAWAEDFAYVGTMTLISLGIIAVLMYLVDLAATAYGARHFGASGRAMVGAAVGALVGLFFGLPGVLIGPFLGAMIGELSMRRPIGSAGRAGVGAWVGMAIGTAAKLALGFVMIGVFLVVRFL